MMRTKTHEKKLSSNVPSSQPEAQGFSLCGTGSANEVHYAPRGARPREALKTCAHANTQP